MSKKTVRQTPIVSKTGSNRTLIIISLIILSIIFIIVCSNNKFIQDDAYISFRYVQNFVDGHGLVFNIGEKVEGYTNLLWVLILSVFALMKISIENVSQILSMLFGVIVLVMSYFLSNMIKLKSNTDSKQIRKNISEDSDQNINIFDLIPTVFLLFTGSFIFWSVSGMETTMFMSFCLLGIYYYIKDKNSESPNFRFPIFILLATLTRPEGLYFFGLILIHRFVLLIKEKKGEGIKEFFSKKNIISYSIYVIPVIFYFLIRYSYYGYLFPNTYYAKTGFSSVYLNSGLEYFMKFFSSYLLYGVVLIAPLYLFKNSIKKDNFFEISLFYFLIVSFILYVISVGGDVLKQNRFFLPVLPLIYILFAKFLTEIYFKIRHSIGKAASLAIVLIISSAICIYYYSSQKEKLDSEIQSENGLVDKMKITGNWFKTKQQILGRPLNLAATTIGSVSYFAGSNVNVIDILGLTDKEIAHNPKLIPEISAGIYGWKERNYNADYLMSRDPDYIYFSTGVKPSAYGERALFTTEEFMKYYYPYYFTDRNSQFSEVVYKRKTDEQVSEMKWDYPGNPNYKNVFVNKYNDALNTSRDKSRNQIALTEFKQTIEMGPAGFDQPYKNIGDIYLQQGNKQKAIENYLKSIEINDMNILSHYQLYQIYSEAGDTVSARASYNKILKYDPEILK